MIVIYLRPHSCEKITYKTLLPLRLCPNEDKKEEMARWRWSEDIKAVNSWKWNARKRAEALSAETTTETFFFDQNSLLILFNAHFLAERNIKVELMWLFRRRDILDDLQRSFLFLWLNWYFSGTARKWKHQQISSHSLLLGQSEWREMATHKHFNRGEKVVHIRIGQDFFFFRRKNKLPSRRSNYACKSRSSHVSALKSFSYFAQKNYIFSKSSIWIAISHLLYCCKACRYRLWSERSFNFHMIRCVSLCTYERSGVAAHNTKKLKTR